VHDPFETVMTQGRQPIRRFQRGAHLWDGAPQLQGFDVTDPMTLARIDAERKRSRAVFLETRAGGGGRCS